MHVTYGFFLTVFFCSLIRASDIPVAPVIFEPITLRIENETTDGKPIEVVIEKARFPFFAEMLDVLGSQEGAVASDVIPVNYHGITSDAVLFLDTLDQAIPIEELKTFTKSCENGTYFTPKSSYAFFTQQTPTMAQLHGAITAAHFLLRPDLMDLLLCQYAQQILTNSIARDKAKELEFSKQPDSALAKILINKALMKKFASAKAMPLDINWDGGKFHSSINDYAFTTQNIVSLCPTPGKYSCLVTETDPESLYTRSIMRTKQWGQFRNQKNKSGNYYYFEQNSPQDIRRQFSDQQADGPHDIHFIIFSNPPYFSYSFVLVNNPNFPTEDRVPATELNTELKKFSEEELMERSKIIFEPNSDAFYLKINDQIWLCSFLVGQRYIRKKEEIQLDTIKDPWVKKYLSSEPEKLGTCWGIMPCSKDDFFNSCCLDAYRCSEEYKEKIQNDLSKKLNGGDWQVAQQTYNVPDSKQYSLFRDDIAGKYYLTTTIFKLDARAELLIKSMNELYKKTPYDSKKPLYASAAYINQALEKDYRLTDAEMKDAPQEIKEIIFPKGRMNSFIRNYITPYERQIKWGLAGLGLGVASYAVYKTMQRQNNFGAGSWYNQIFGRGSKGVTTYIHGQSSGILDRRNLIR